MGCKFSQHAVLTDHNQHIHLAGSPSDSQINLLEGRDSTAPQLTDFGGDNPKPLPRQDEVSTSGFTIAGKPVPDQSIVFVGSLYSSAGVGDSQQTNALMGQSSSHRSSHASKRTGLAINCIETRPSGIVPSVPVKRVEREVELAETREPKITPVLGIDARARQAERTDGQNAPLDVDTSVDGLMGRGTHSSKTHPHKEQKTKSDRDGAKIKPGVQKEIEKKQSRNRRRGTDLLMPDGDSNDLQPEIETARPDLARLETEEEIPNKEAVEDIFDFDKKNGGIINNRAAKNEKSIYKSSAANSLDHVIRNSKRPPGEKIDQLRRSLNDEQLAYLKLAQFRLLMKNRRTNDMATTTQEFSANNLIMAEILVESSIVGSYVMLPWDDEDLDIRNDFWMSKDPTGVVDVMNSSDPSGSTLMLTATAHERTFNISSKSKTRSENEASGMSPPDGKKAKKITKHQTIPVRVDAMKEYMTRHRSKRTLVATSSQLESCTASFPDPSSPGTDVSCGSHDQNALSESPCALSHAFGSVRGWQVSESGTYLWKDPDGHLALSQKQISKIDDWKRLTELQVPMPSVDNKDGQGRVERSTANIITDSLGRQLRPGDLLDPIVIAGKPRARSIRQGFVGDCSFLSSLAALAEYEARVGSPVISRIIHPQVIEVVDDRTVVRPLINHKGMYACKLHFNGTMRKVCIDDFVPVRKDGKLLPAHSANKREMWITILEKAFVKLMGGSYFMHGSNPGGDLYHLSGWIPETIPFRRDIHTGSPDMHSPIVTGGESSTLDSIVNDPKWTFIWTQLYRGFRTSSCVACLGTSEIADAAPSGLDFPEGVSLSSGIVAKHAYSVLSCREVDGVRLIHARNPWACIRWRGKYSAGDSAWTPSLERALRYDSKQAAESDNGTFWIEWADVVRWFSHLYICWNNNCFKDQHSIHLRWGDSVFLQKSVLQDDSHLVAFNPQLHLEILPILVDSESELRNVDKNSEAEIWILLSRHIKERRKDLAQKYLAVHVHRGKKRVSCPNPPVLQGVYSNGECSLLKLKVKTRYKIEKNREYRERLRQIDSTQLSNLSFETTLSPIPKSVTTDRSGIIKSPSATLDVSDLVLVVSQYSQKTEFNFTVKVFSTDVKIRLSELPPLIPDGWTSVYLQSEWTDSTAGGCSNNIWSFFANPTFRLHVPRKCSGYAFLESPSELSVNLRVFSGPFGSARLLRTGVTASSGPYRAACCMLELELEAGDHTMIASNFKPGDCGPFQIAVHISIPPSELKSKYPIRKDAEESTSFTGSDYNSLGDTLDECRKRTLRTKQTLINPSAVLNPRLELYSLPVPYALPPHPSQGHSVFHGGDSGTVLEDLYSIKCPLDASYTPIALRVSTMYMDPPSTFPSVTLLFVPFNLQTQLPFPVAVVPSHIQRAMKSCVTRTNKGSHSSNKSLSPFVIKKSDLEGGLSEDGMTSSTAAQLFYTNNNAVCLTHANIQPESMVDGRYFIFVTSRLMESLNPPDKSRQRCPPETVYTLNESIAYGSFQLDVIGSAKLAVEPIQYTRLR